MRPQLTFASLLLFGVPAMAQQGGFPAPAPASPARVQQLSATTPDNQGPLELLELEQETDKTLLKEAMMTLGRKALQASMERPANNEADKKDAAQQTEALRSFIAEKKDAILKRSAEIKTVRDEPIRLRRADAASQANSRRAPMTNEERQEQIEKMETSQAENQLLQRQVQIYQNGLTEAIEALANAEFVASNDETQKDSAEAAKKRYEKAKARFVEISKRAQLEQQKFNELQQQVGMGGMGGGGMGGMGGGYR